jgi:hypothetical protein
VHQHGPPAAGPPRHIGGRAVVVYVGIIVQVNGTPTAPTNTYRDSTKITRTSATRATSGHPHISISNDGQHLKQTKPVLRVFFIHGSGGRRLCKPDVD